MAIVRRFVLTNASRAKYQKRLSRYILDPPPSLWTPLKWLEGLEKQQRGDALSAAVEIDVNGSRALVQNTLQCCYTDSVTGRLQVFHAFSSRLRFQHLAALTNPSYSYLLRYELRVGNTASLIHQHRRSYMTNWLFMSYWTVCELYEILCLSPTFKLSVSKLYFPLFVPRGIFQQKLLSTTFLSLQVSPERTDRQTNRRTDRLQCADCIMRINNRSNSSRLLHL